MRYDAAFLILNFDLHLGSKIELVNIIAQQCHQISHKYSDSFI